MGPSNANAGRGDWFRATLGRPVTITMLVLGASAALVLGAAFGGPAAAALAPVAVVVAIVAIVWWIADRKAENVFWKHVADSLGYEPFFDPTALETTTPLLHAGDRRHWRHELMGPLGDSGLTARLAQYRYEVRHESSNDKTPDKWTSYRYTICLVELESGMPMFPGLYLRERRGLLGGLDHDWLDGRRLTGGRAREHRVQRDLRAADRVAAGRGSPARVLRPEDDRVVSEHPLRPHVEFRAGFLVVYVPGYLEDLGRVVWLLEAAERIAGRVVAEVGEAHATVAGEPAPG